MNYLSTSRRLHLDFHTPPFIKDVAKNLDAIEFARTLKASGIEAVAAFAKCHYGLSYYPTTVGEVHPGLHYDMLGSIVKACHKEGIQVSAYYSLLFDVAYCKRHPDCEQADLKRKEVGGFWKVTCINTSYADYAIAQMCEIAKNYPIHGFWLDMVGYYSLCVCNCCKERFERETGQSTPACLATARENDDNYLRYVLWQRGCVEEFIRKARECIRKINPSIVVCCNTPTSVYEKASGAFSVEDDGWIEETPTSYGSFYTYISYCSKLFASNPGKRPFEICTNRFHQGWGDWTLRSSDWLKFEAATIAANGGKVSIGDQMYADGRWEKNVYRNIGETYHWLSERESVLGDADSVSEVAVYVAGMGVHAEPIGIHTNFNRSDVAEGAFRALLDEQYPFDLITKANLQELNKYRVIIIDQPLAPSREELLAFEKYLASGGNLVYIVQPQTFSRPFAWSDYHTARPGQERHAELLSLFGVNSLSPAAYSVCYIDRFDAELYSDADHLPMLVRERAFIPELKSDAKVLARLTFPEAERSEDHFISHQHGHPARQTDSAAISVVKCGNGKAVFISAPITSVYYDRQYAPLRELLVKCLDYLTPRLAVVENAPTSMELVLKRKDNAMVVHLLNPSLARPTSRAFTSNSSNPDSDMGWVVSADRGISIAGLQLRIRRDAVNACEARLIPGNEILKVGQQGEYFVIELPPICVHAAIKLSERLG